MTTYNASHPGRVDARNRRERRARERRDNDVKWLMSTPEGRRVAWHLLSMAGLFRTSFTGDSNTTCFNEGQRNLGLMLQSDILQVCPEKYLLAMKEAKRVLEEDEFSETTPEEEE